MRWGRILRQPGEAPPEISPILPATTGNDTNWENRVNRRHFVRTSIAAAVAVSFHRELALAAMADGSSVGADIKAVTGSGKEVLLSQSAVQELADSLRGGIALPGSEAYERARQLLNPRVNRYPALVVQPVVPTDVANAVRFARQENLITAVKCGGHSFRGDSTCDGGMQIDLSRLRGVRVDPARQTAWVAGGSLLGDLDAEAMARGLVTTAGSVSHTGVGGLTLGGGFGRLGRRFGLTIDNLLSVDIVTADGQLRHVSKDENPDLFWAVRGGGGNFGVVTAFEFQLHPMERQVISGSYGFPFEQARQVLEFASEFAAEAPDELQVTPFLGAFPGNGPICNISIVYSGPQEKAAALLAPIEKAGKVVRNTVQSWDYVALQKSGDTTDFRANGAYIRSGFVDEISPAMVRDMVETFRPHPGRATWMAIGHSGGAIGRVPYGATAFTNRKATHDLLSFVGWPISAGDGSEHIAYVNEQWKVMEPYTDGFYINDLANETQAQVDANYGANLARLVQVKNTYDPTNLFRLNANVRPTV
jgi:FAD/FMN-containing dehydrogenase